MPSYFCGMELGFMINPEEFEWIIDPEEREKLARAIARGIAEWAVPSNSNKLTTIWKY